MTSTTQIDTVQSSSDTNYLVAVWAVLMGLTGVSWWLGSSHGPIAALATVIILVITFGKVLLVGWSFMELRNAAPLLQAIFAGWCVVTCVALIVLAEVL